MRTNQDSTTMYRFSRSIYRELAQLIPGAPDSAAALRSRKDLLRVAEATMERLAFDPDFAAPARSLFEQIRWYFSLQEQERVRRVVERHVQLALEFLESLSTEELTGLGRRCVAYRRDGTPGQRRPAPGSNHCPSHRHLAEPLVEAGAEAGVEAGTR